MKTKVAATILALSVFSFATSHSSAAQTGGPAAGGSYRFILHDDVVKTVEFDSRTDREGRTTGWMTFIDQVKLPNQDVDGTGDKGDGDAPLDFYVKADFNHMTVEKNRAVMNGTIIDSSHRSYIGKCVQLAVEDNALNRERPDTLSWRLCPPDGNWIPTDAEWKDDQGAWLSWWATDAERKDDVGIPSHSYLPSEIKHCPKYVLSTYAYVEILKWDGDIIVTP